MFTKILKRATYAALVITGMFFTVFAAGPSKIAVYDIANLQGVLSSDSSFDLISRISILCMVSTLDNLPYGDAELVAFTGLKSVDTGSVRKWKESFITILHQNFNAASQHYISTSPCWFGRLVDIKALHNYATDYAAKLPAELLELNDSLKLFFNNYVYEQVRLAALFPSISSEIATFSSDEINGAAFKDRTFLLTFDDGPTKSNGNTDQLLQCLHSNNKSGLFFTLGEQLKIRMAATSDAEIRELYKGMRLGAHGTTHVSHAKSDAWLTSITNCQSVIDSGIGKSVLPMYFRPPYGQRKNNASEILSQSNIKVMLWNIDSQDWNAKFTSGKIAGRTMLLMTLWRKGILLFHDVHPKASIVLPELFSLTSGTSVVWLDALTFDR